MRSSTMRNMHAPSAGTLARRRVKPGMTGWAHGQRLARRDKKTIEQMQARVKYDIYYVEHWNSLLFGFENSGTDSSDLCDRQKRVLISVFVSRLDYIAAFFCAALIFCCKCAIRTQCECLLELLGGLGNLACADVTHAEMILNHRAIRQPSRRLFEQVCRALVVAPEIVDPAERVLERRDFRFPQYCRQRIRPIDARFVRVVLGSRLARLLATIIEPGFCFSIYSYSAIAAS